MCRTYVICGFSGIGKSTAANKSRKVYDLESSQWSRLLEGHNPAFPNNYVDYLENLIRDMDTNDPGAYLLLSCHEEVRKELHRRGISFVIVLPQPELRNEYMQRWIRRGSPVQFLTTMYDRWDEMINSCMEDSAPKIFLGPGQNLADLITI